MAEQRLIQVSVQLPASELGRLSALLDQLQRVLSAGQAEGCSSPEGDTAAEQGENAAFDQERFSALSRHNELAQAVPVQASAETEAISPLSAARELEGQTPEPAGARPTSASEPPREREQAAEPVPGRLPDTPAVRTAAESGGEVPPSAGFSVGGSPDISNGRNAVLEERLTAAGPASLTAEAVSLAFRRDDRRYDNGFPLY